MIWFGIVVAGFAALTEDVAAGDEPRERPVLLRVEAAEVVGDGRSVCLRWVGEHAQVYAAGRTCVGMEEVEITGCRDSSDLDSAATLIPTHTCRRPWRLLLAVLEQDVDVLSRGDRVGVDDEVDDVGVAEYARKVEIDVAAGQRRELRRSCQVERRCPGSGPGRC